jgi:DNA-binding Xre family transcriptional regulator
MEMRVRIPELLEQRGLTPYSLAMKSGSRISLSAAHRLARAEGRVKLFSAELLEALCDVLEVEPGELLEREATKSRARR